jgi:hypothetical protein
MAISTLLFKEAPVFSYEYGKSGTPIGSGVSSIITNFGRGIIPVNSSSGIYWSVPSSSNTAGKPFTLTTTIVVVTGGNTRRLVGIGGSPGTSFLSFFMEYSAIALYLKNASVITASPYKYSTFNVITLTATYNGLILSFFIDDRLIGTYSSNNLGSTTSTNLTIGDGVYFYSHGGVAVLDAVLWDRCLAIDEVLYFRNPKSQKYSPILQGFPTGPRRGLMLLNGNIQMVPTGSLGTGIKPLVIMTSGEIKERATSEGAPLTVEEGNLRTLSPSETLEI